MRVLVTTFPGKGHFHPVAPLALALQRAAHDVRVATGSDLGDWVRGCGLRAITAGMSLIGNVETAASVPPAERTVRQFTTIAVPPFVDDVMRACDEWRPDVIVNEEGEHSGPLLAALLSARSVTHSWPAPARPWAEQAERVVALEEVWRSFGRTEQTRLYGDTYLDSCPPPLQTDSIASVDGVRTVRPTIFDGPNQAPPPWLADVVAPVALVSLGTVPIFARADALSTIVQAVAPVVGTVIVATGPNATTAVPDLPNARVATYLPFSAVLPVTDTVVSHGGAGTTTASLIAGVRHLVVPQGAPSQQRAAERVSELGFGRAVGGSDLDERVIAQAVTDLLADAEVGARLDAARATISSLPDPDELARGYR